jgi:glycine/D-amino acid oxidase-like deaminating enzyme
VTAPGWDEDPVVLAWPGLPALDGDRSADACVVGLGASGLAAIAELLDRGLSVIGLDAGRVAAGAAGRNGGFLLGGAAPFLHTAIERWGTDAAVSLYRATLVELDRLGAELGSTMIRRTGSIRLAGLPGAAFDADEARERTREEADIARHAQALREHTIAVEDYDGELGRGIFLPDDAATNPAARVLVAADSLRRRGAELYENTPVARVSSGRVDCAGGTVTAALIVVAVDGGLGQLLPALASHVHTARLQMVRTAPSRCRLARPVYGRWGYDYAQADAAGRLYVGGGRDRFEAAEWTTASAPTESVQDYIGQVAARFAGEAVSIERRWGASVGYTVDGRAIVAEVDAGVVACGGYSGTGNLVGPIAARAAVSLGLAGTPPPSYFRASIDD